MKVLMLNSSPRVEGNTYLMLKKLAEVFETEGIASEIVQLGRSGIMPCKACNGCFKTKNKKCVFNNDIFNSLMEKALASDAIVIGTPTYFADMTPEAKSFIDRCGYVSFANGGLLKRKLGAAVVAQRRGGATSAFSSINFFFLMSEMIVAGSTYWNLGFGQVAGEVASDKEAMLNMENLAQNMSFLLKKLKAPTK